MSYYTDIQRLMDMKLIAITGVDVAWENVNYSPTHGTPWIRPTLILGDADIATLDRRQSNVGVYQVDAFYPTEKGSKDLNEKLDEIYDLFKTENKIETADVSVFIDAVTKLGASEREEAWFVGSIQVNFRSYELIQ